MKSVAIAAGGTGGHFYPGLAVAHELKSRGERVFFIVRTNDKVISFLNEESFPFCTIQAGGFRRSLDPRNLISLIKLIVGFFQSVLLMFGERPKALLVMGGYLSVPPALAARMAGIPVVLHEQNVLPGLANRTLGWLAAKVAVSFESDVSTFDSKAVLTGNPVRAEFKMLPAAKQARVKWSLDPSRKTFLIFGGSLGARNLNRLVLKALAELAAFAGSVQLIHFTGASDFETIKAGYERLQYRFHVAPYCHEMPFAYAAADLVICRSGATTVTELVAVKMPAILVPYPYATGGHQRMNADVLVRAGAGAVYEENQLERGELTSILRGLIADSRQIMEWEEGYGRLPIDPFKAAYLIADLTLGASM